MIKLKRRERGNVVILELAGRLMGGADSEMFQKQVRDLIEQGRLQIVVDLHEVAWINSSGLGMLISSFSALRDKGGSLKLLNVSRRIEQILQVTKLNTIFESYSDEDSVVGSFKN